MNTSSIEQRVRDAEIERDAAGIVARALDLPRGYIPIVALRRSSNTPPRLAARIVSGATEAGALDLSPAMLVALLASNGRILRPHSGSVSRALRSRGLLTGSCIATDLALAVRAMLRSAIAADTKERAHRYFVDAINSAIDARTEDDGDGT